MYENSSLQILTNLGIVLILGILMSVLSNKLKVANVLLLLLTGIGLSQITIGGSPLINFSTSFLLAIGTLTLILITFDGSGRFEFKTLNELFNPTFKLTTIFLLLNLIILTPIVSYLFFKNFILESILASAILASLMSGTDPSSVFIMLKNKAKYLIEILEMESIINTPITVIVPFIILDFITGTEQGVTSYLPILLQQVIVAIGTGVVIGIIVFKTMKKSFSETLSPVAIIAASLLAYVIAENLNGTGVLAVATLGVMFGNIYLKEKQTLQGFNSMLSNSLEILVFILIGVALPITLSWQIALKSLLIFVIAGGIRFISLKLSFGNQFKLKELIFMTFSMSKGIAVAVVIFTLAIMNITSLNIIFNAMIYVVIYSLISSSIVNLNSKRLINIKLEK